MSSKNVNTDFAIRIRGLSKSYGRVQALRSIDLDVRHGEIYGFLGPNGAGKTTTIRCMLDSIRPDDGEISLLGLNPQETPISVQAHTGYLPGEMQFYENLTAEKQLRFFSDMRGKRVDHKYIQQLAERLKLDLTQQIKNLSKGNKQKVGVIQALMHKPALLLLDEPTAGLDPLMQQEMLDILRESNQEGATVFFSSHIMSEVEQIANRVAIIRFGEIAEVADPSTLTHRSMKRVMVRFKQTIDLSPFSDLNGVTLRSNPGDMITKFEVSGDMEAFVHLIGQHPVIDLETETPSLEDIFLTYYKE